MIYGRGTVWIICSEQYDPKFYHDNFAWRSEITEATFYSKKEYAESDLDFIKTHPEMNNLRPEELKYTSIIELELVQYWPEIHKE